MSAAPALILASRSPARARLLAAAGLTFAIEPSAVDEDEIKARAMACGLNAEATALELALAKAKAVSARHPGAFVLGADQMLSCDGRWFDKPRDQAEARENLLFLRGREQHLISAVAIARDGKPLWETVDLAKLWMRPFSERFLDDYLECAGDEVLLSVGGCRLEDAGIQFFERIDGDFFTILGLPLLPLLSFLRSQGLLCQ